MSEIDFEISKKNKDRIQIEADELKRQAGYMSLVREIISRKSVRKGRSLTACVITFGCQMNERDSEKLKGIIKECGYELTDNEDSDLVIYNTCTVRENANLRLYGRLGHTGAAKRNNPDMLVGVCGCMAQEPDVVDKLERSYGFVDIIFGTFNVYKLAELLHARLTGGSRIIDIWQESREFVELLPTQRKYSFKSGVNIMYGCDNFCTYCIVPFVRGREKSRAPEEIISEIKTLVSTGVIEVMLLGQNVNSYGKGLEEKVSFAGLLKRIEAIEGLARIRFMTSHPMDLSDELIDVMASSKKICDHIHLPLQSGSNKILKKMNRKYTREDYILLVEKLKKAIPGISITTDIIVGFPGETDDDFKDTVDMVKRCGFDSAFTFIYSKRTGTPAASMEGLPDEKTVKNRFEILLDVVKRSGTDRASELLGMRKAVLVEEINDHDASLVTGRLTNNMLVHFPGEKDLVGTITEVEITESKGFYFFGINKE